MKGMRYARLACLICLLLAGTLAGCGKPLEVERDTVYIQKKGAVVGAAIANLDKDYYDEDELKKYVDSRVGEYQKGHGEDSVEVDRFSVEGGVAKLYINYASCKDYQDFNEVTLFSGTIPQSLVEGFDFNAGFKEIKEGKLAGDVDNKSVMDMDAKVVVISEKVDVKVDGTIRYVSADYATVSGKDTVSLRLPEDAGDGEEASLVYVVYE